MSINILIGGKLVKDPKPGTGKNGSPYCTASVRISQETQREDEPNSVFASLIAFGADAEKLARLRQGDQVSVAGSCRVSTWTSQEGVTTPTLNIQATGILSVYDIKQRKPQSHPRDETGFSPEQRQAADRLYGKPGSNSEPDFDDQISF